MKTTRPEVEFDPKALVEGNDVRVQKINSLLFKPDPPRSGNGPTGFRQAAQKCQAPASALLGT